MEHSPMGVPQLSAGARLRGAVVTQNSSLLKVITFYCFNRGYQIHLESSVVVLVSGNSWNVGQYGNFI